MQSSNKRLKFGQNEPTTNRVKKNGNCFKTNEKQIAHILDSSPPSTTNCFCGSGSPKVDPINYPDLCQGRGPTRSAGKTAKNRLRHKRKGAFSVRPSDGCRWERPFDACTSKFNENSAKVTAGPYVIPWRHAKHGSPRNGRNLTFFFLHFYIRRFRNAPTARETQTSVRRLLRSRE